jgi:sugar phosphate isomerase/epimerase
MDNQQDTATKKLSLCWGSLDGVDLRDFMGAAVQAGFSSITLSPAQYHEALSLGLKDRDISQLLDTHGLKVSNIDPLFNWLPSSVELPGDDVFGLCSRTSADDIFHIAHVAGTDLVNAPIGLATPDSEQQIIDYFGKLCNRAAKEGLRVSLEFMPFNQVCDLATANRVVTKAGCDNGGIMFDCWHHHRSGGVPEDVLAVPPEKFFALQMDDAMDQPMDDIMDETLNHRLLPGEGCIDLVQTLVNLNTIGADIVYDVEVFKDSLRSKAPAERAQAMFDSASEITSKVMAG